MYIHSRNTSIEKKHYANIFPYSVANPIMMKFYGAGGEGGAPGGFPGAGAGGPGGFPGAGAGGAAAHDDGPTVEEVD